MLPLVVATDARQCQHRICVSSILSFLYPKKFQITDVAFLFDTKSSFDVIFSVAHFSVLLPGTYSMCRGMVCFGTLNKN